MNIRSGLSTLKNDLPAGLVVFLVALPLCLGIALASGAPPFSGVIAGIIGGILIGILSGSPLGVSGPAAGLAGIVLVSIQKLGSFEGFLLAVVLSGVFQLVLGYARAGIIGHYFPSSVIKGMLAAIGLTLILKQIPHALGYDADFEGDDAFVQRDGRNTLTEIYYAMVYHSKGAVFISLISICIIIGWDKLINKVKIKSLGLVPSALIVVILGILINYFFGLYFPQWQLGESHLVNLPKAGNGSEFLQNLSFPDFSFLQKSEVYVIALTIAIVGSLETLLSVEAADKIDPYKRVTPTNRELKAQGWGNILSGLIGGLPVTQVIVRSSANVTAGGRTKFSAIFHGFLLLVSVIAIPGLLNKIPLACLAAVLLLVGYKLAKVSLFKDMYKLGWVQFIPFMITILAILFTDLLKGIAIGMAVGVFFILRDNYKASVNIHKEGDRYLIRLSEQITFLSKGSILAALNRIPKHSRVVIDGYNNLYLDHDVNEIIKTFKESALLKNIEVELRGFPDGVSPKHEEDNLVINQA